MALAQNGHRNQWGRTEPGIDPDSQENIIAYDDSFLPYMYILTDEIDETICQLKELDLDNVEVETKIDIGIEREFIKVIFKHPQEVPKLRDTIRDMPSVEQIREYDIPFYRRYLIDKQITPSNVLELRGKTIDNDTYDNLSIDDDVILFKLEENPIDTHQHSNRNKILSFDIEVYNAQGMPNAEDDDIIMMSLSSNYGLDKVLSTKESKHDYVETLDSE